MPISKNSKIFVAGHKGMVGSAIIKKLKLEKYKNIITIEKKKLDLLDQYKTEIYLKKTKPNVVIIAAAKVGGIYANQKNKPQFIYENLMIQTNLIHSSYIAGVKNLIFLGSSCIYPKLAKQPLKEKYILTGKLESTNDAYAVAKIAGIKMCEAYNEKYNLNYLSLMPTNLYGSNDNYDSKNSHFIPALIKKIYSAKLLNKKEITLWGNGKPKREVMHVDDLADACEFFLRKKTKEKLINVGSGKEFTIKQYCKLIMKIMKCKLKIKFDPTKPNGTPRKILNLSLAKKYGWKSKITFEEGIKSSINDFIKNYKI